MSKRRASREHRCPRCQINQALCFCEQLTPIINKTPVLVVMHWREKWLTSNSTNVAIQCLTRISTVYRGVKGQTVNLSDIDQSQYSPIYLFPDQEAQELNQDNLAKLPLPPALVIPDGTWSQAIKFHRREPALKDLPHFKLPYVKNSKYQLRKAHFEGALSTLEAMAAALGIIESKAIQNELESRLDIMVERFLATRSN